jgi:hypothetical protein
MRRLVKWPCLLNRLGIISFQVEHRVGLQRLYADSLSFFGPRQDSSHNLTFCKKKKSVIDRGHTFQILPSLVQLHSNQSRSDNIIQTEGHQVTKYLVRIHT